MNLNVVKIAGVVIGLTLAASSCKSTDNYNSNAALESSSGNDPCHRPNPQNPLDRLVMPPAGNYTTTSTEGACNFVLTQLANPDKDGNRFSIKFSSNEPTNCKINKGKKLNFRLFFNNSFQSECFTTKGGESLEHYGLVVSGSSTLFVNHNLALRHLKLPFTTNSLESKSI